MSEKTINDHLFDIQQKLVAPKGQYNNHGKYKYRSCEDIVEAVKPLLRPISGVLTLSDEIIQVLDRVYVKATATLTVGAESYSVSASAREAFSRKGMDESQITGAASSYARKYALNGLFAIDDTRDADATNKHNDEDLMSEDQVIAITDALTEAQYPIENFLRRAKAEKIGSIAASRYDGIMAHIKKVAESGNGSA